VPQPIVAIDDDDRLYRRMVPDHFHEDGSVKSNAYKLNGKPDPSISVDLARLTTPEESIARGQRQGTQVGVLTVREIKALGLTVRHDPTNENPSHCLIEGNAKKETCKALGQMTKRPG
jgi:hypothetical protein